MMKRGKTIKCLLTTLCMLVVCTIAQGKDGYSFYQEDGKWGVLYNGEPCLLPRYEEVADIDGGGRFFYKENGKWGIANVWKKVCEPFCDSLKRWYDESQFTPYVKSSYQRSCTTIYMFAINGKWGLCHCDGTEILAPIYDDIYKKILDYEHLGLAYKEVTYKGKNGGRIGKFACYNKYFLVKTGNTTKLIDICGTEILPDAVSYEYFFSKKGSKILKKQTREFELARMKEDVSEASKEKMGSFRSYSTNVTEANILFRDYRQENYEGIEYAHEDYKKDDYHAEEMKGPRGIYFGRKGKEFFPPQGDTLTINGMESITNSYGFISTPLMYDCPISAFNAIRATYLPI